MFYKKKKTSYLLLELLIGLLLLSACFPLFLRSFSSLIHLNQTWEQEEILQAEVDELFLTLKKQLNFKEIHALLKEEDSEIKLKNYTLLVNSKEVPLELFVSKEEEKNAALLLKLTLYDQSKPGALPHKFSQIYCLKK